MKLDPQEIRAFQKKILDWYKKNKRNLPWRHPSLKLRNGIRDPYKILVSEVMSQQTQISRVIPKYEAWMQAFPTIQDLAKASTRDVLLHWSGLGYNRRALYVKKTAKELVRHSGEARSADARIKKGTDSGQTSVILSSRARLASSQLCSKNKILKPPRQAQGKQVQNDNIAWPQTEKELRKFPGIGEYTARALLCFAFGKQIAVVDTNVRKVILTHFFCERNEVKPRSKPSTSPSTVSSDRKKDSPQVQNSKKGLTEKEIQEIAHQLLPRNQAYEWNQALMDYSALVVSKDSHAQTLLRQGFGKAGQSKFKDSDRYYRGVTIKILLKENHLSFHTLFERVLQISQIEQARYRIILNQLEIEGLITRKKDIFFLC